MTALVRFMLVVTLAAAANLWAGANIAHCQPAPGASDAALEAVVKNYLARHPEDVEVIVRDYLAAHPEVVQAALLELVKRKKAAAPDMAAAIKGNSDELLNSRHQVTLGNPDGDVTLVEFFDYNCGYCKRALPDLLALLKDDPKLKVVLKEFPILGPGSMEAARVAVALRMQDPAGEKYLAFHQAMLGGRGPAGNESARAAAEQAGADMARLDRDLGSDEVRETLDESVKLAQSLGIHGTPGYVIGDGLIPGAIGVAALKKRIQEARDRHG